MSEDLGLSPQAATLAFGFGTPAPTAPARTGPPVAPSPVEPHSDCGRSPEAVTMAEWIKEDLAKGKLTRTRRSTNWAPRWTNASRNRMRARTNRKLIDQHFPVARPEEFRIAYAQPGQAWPEMTPALKQFDESARSWLVGAEFPANLANSLITTIAKVAQ